MGDDKPTIGERLEKLLIVFGMTLTVYFLAIGEIDAATTLVEMVADIVENNL